MACEGRIITRNSTMGPASSQRMMSMPSTYLQPAVASTSTMATSLARTASCSEKRRRNWVAGKRPGGRSEARRRNGLPRGGA